MSDRDQSAIATWERHDQGDDPGRQTRSASRYNGPLVTHECAVCCWHGDYMGALEHHVQQGHGITRFNMPHWGEIVFPAPYINRMRRRLANAQDK